MQKEKIGMENGRSMVEVLAVLALAGVFAISGTVGYRYAMRLYQEAETLDQLSVLIAGGRSGDIPLHYGFQTVGLSDAYVPYIVPIRDVVSRVRYRSDETAFDAGLIDDEGKLVGGDVTKMREVRELESFDTLLDAPAWVRAEDENNWTVRVTGLSYSLCEKLLRKSELGFDYAYVALQNIDKTPADPLMGDFAAVLKDNKYANPDRDGEDGVATVEQIEKVCAMIDPTKGHTSLAQTYIRNLEKEGETGVAPGADAYCSDKKSLACMAFGARLYNPETKEIDLPLQTLVLYFGQKGGDIPIEPMPATCVPGTPYTEESGGNIESQECCEMLGEDKYFIPGIPKCCQLVEDIKNTPRCKVGPDGRYVVQLTPQIDALGNPVVDANGLPVYDETWVFDTDDITSEEEVYIAGNWAGEDDEGCCPAFKPTPTQMGCHLSSITNGVLPWPIIGAKGTTNSQYQNCPLATSFQTSEITTEFCCTGSGEYWAEADGVKAGTVSSSESGQALCCSQNNVFTLRSVSTTEQCPWEAVSNVPASGTAVTGPVPKDVMGTVTTDCCYKTTGRGKLLKTSACAFEGGVLKYSKECCNVATDMQGQQLAYVEAPHYSVGGSISQECGVIAAYHTSVAEPDRNCCVDYKALEASLGNGKKLGSNQLIQDWSGMPAPEYCCKTLIGTALAPTEGDMKKNFEQCCEADLYFATTNSDIRKKATFIPMGTEVRAYAVSACPAPLTGSSCSPTGPKYITTENFCCDLSTGKASDGTENKVCCEYAAMTNNTRNYWDGTQCALCPTCTVNPGPVPNPEYCYDVCEFTEWVEPEEVLPEQTTQCITNGTGCWIGRNNACCQSFGYAANGSRTCNCCKPPADEGVKHGDSCFFLKDADPSKPPKPDCLDTTTTATPGVQQPGYMATNEKVLRQYECPEGVAKGTKFNIGPCPG